MSSYSMTPETTTSTVSRHWWTSRRLMMIVFLIALIVASIALVGTPEETLLLALDGNNGHTQWSMPAPMGIGQRGIGIPTAVNGRLYVSVVTPPASNSLLPNYGWELRALDSASGARVWTFTPDPKQFGKVAAEITASFGAIVTQDTVYVTLVALDYQVWLVALDVQTGQVKWAHSDLYFNDSGFRGLAGLILNYAQYSKYTVVGDKVFALLRAEDDDDPDAPTTTTALTLIALNAQTGETLWSKPITLDNSKADKVVETMVATETDVYLSIDKTYVYDAATGDLKQTEDAALVFITSNTIYQQHELTLTATDRATGQQRWQYTPPANTGCMRFTVNEQTLYAFCARGEDDSVKLDDAAKKLPANWTNFLLALDVQTGAERWRKPIAENLFTVVGQVPATYGDRVVVVGGALGELRVVALTSSGDEAWSYHLERGYDLAVSDGNRVFVTDTRPRWRGWLAWLNPAWR
ncbi:MAG: PQQ-binding-like beta-propeller repeat protein [Anaerolineae bacterium]|nr:PQQ-binding-like beta-propeller repeat protein [Anaerolineae bacterium]